MEVRRQAQDDPSFDPVRNGWYVGSDQFRQELLAQVNALAGPRHAGSDIREGAEAKAVRILEEELHNLKWGTEQLLGRRKGGRQKLRIAARLRRETTMTLAWIAERLHMGVASHLACLLYRQQQNATSEPSENTMF